MPAERVQVEVVTDRRDHLAFCELPYRLYSGDASWVPPLRGEERDRWSPRHNASLRSRWTQRFLARRGDAIVGRIAAIVDPAFGERWQSGAGFFGFFECAHDAEAAKALLAAAESALSVRGRESVLGPVNLSTQDEVGLLVEGFDLPPTLLTSYHPPYYKELIEGAGYGPRLDYHAYHCDPMHPHDPVIDRLLRASRGSGLTVRPSRPDRWESENRLLFELYNRSFEREWGFVPLEWDEYRERAERFRPFYHPDLVLIAEWGGRPVGFAVGLPDINVALAGVGGNLWPFGWMKLMRSARAIRSLRLLLLGVLPEQTGRGVAPLIAHAMVEAARRLGMRSSELSLVQSTNRSIQRVIAAFGGRPVKTFRLYEKRLQG